MSDNKYSVDLKTLADNIKSVGAEHGEIQFNLNGARIKILVDLSEKGRV